VTPKGFNLLDVKTNKCLLKSHLYCHNWSHKDIPIEENAFVMRVHYNMIFKEVECVEAYAQRK
jgi:hypothetical protein